MSKQTVKQVVKQYESLAGKDGRIKTEIYTTDPKTIITIVGNLPDSVGQDLRFLIDGLLKEKGF